MFVVFVALVQGGYIRVERSSGGMTWSLPIAVGERKYMADRSRE